MSSSSSKGVPERHPDSTENLVKGLWGEVSGIIAAAGS